MSKASEEEPVTIEISEERLIELWRDVYSATFGAEIAESILSEISDDAQTKGVSILEELESSYPAVSQQIHDKLKPVPGDSEDVRLAKISTNHKLFEARTGQNPEIGIEEEWTIEDWEGYYADFDKNVASFEEQPGEIVFLQQPPERDPDAPRTPKEIFKEVLDRKNKTKQNIAMLQDAVEKVTRALPVKQGRYDPDCVPVKAGEEEIYLSEVIRAQQINQTKGTIVDVIPMNDEDRLLHLVQFKDGKLVRGVNGKIASTIGMSSKHKENFQSFVLGKDGELYLFNSDRTEKRADGQWRDSTHGAVMDEKPAEMAGIMTINEEGKVTYIEDHSGHYRPEEYDMWRGIKVLKEKGVLSDDCMVNVHGGEISAQEFMRMMEAPGPSGKPLHEELKQDRYVKHARYAIKHQGANAAETLKAAGVDKDYKDSRGETGLHWVFAKIGENKKQATQKRTQLESQLGEASTEDERKKINGEIKKLEAKSAKDDAVLVKAVRDLVAAGYDPSAKDNNGKTPADYAIMHGQTAGLAELQRAQAEIMKGKDQAKMAEKEQSSADKALASSMRQGFEKINANRVGTPVHGKTVAQRGGDKDKAALMR